MIVSVVKTKVVLTNEAMRALKVKTKAGELQGALENEWESLKYEVLQGESLMIEQSQESLL